MLLDCAIIGGGPAGLNAALVLGRARRNTLLFDDNKPRNAVTHEAHGFLTRDGIAPGEFRRLAQQEIGRYPSVSMQQSRVMSVSKHEDLFRLETDDGAVFDARTIILATGQKEILPEIEGIHEYYGKSLFSCPYCDGWENRDHPLVVIAEEGQGAFHMTQILWNWSRNLVVCTNGHAVLSPEQKERLAKNGIGVIEDKITALVGERGMLERVRFAHHEEISCQGGFVVPQRIQAADFATQLGCDTNTMNGMTGIVADTLGRTSVKSVYAAGEVTFLSQLIVSAAQGSMAAAGVNTDLIQQDFL